MLKVLIIRDHRPGHYNQSEGIVKAIARIKPVGVEYADIRRRHVISWRSLYSAYNLGLLSDRWLLDLIYPAMHIEAPPDIVVSSGGETLLYNVIISRQFGSSNIFSGSIRNLKSAFFSAVLTPYRRLSNQPPHIHGLKPCPLDPDEPPRPGRSFDLCFMIGGPSGTHAYTQSHWDKIIDLARKISARRSVAIFSSRRTPPKIVADLKALKNGKTAIFDDKEALAPEMFDYCKRSQAIVVTEDSNSMITEAICCRKPVLVLAPPQNAMNADENAYLQELADNGWLSRMVLDECGTFDRMQERLKAVRPLEFNHLDVLAERLRQALPILQ
jgi:mitochondrial fission protein ELM1